MGARGRSSPVVILVRSDEAMSRRLYHANIRGLIYLSRTNKSTKQPFKKMMKSFKIRTTQKSQSSNIKFTQSQHPAQKVMFLK